MHLDDPRCTYRVDCIGWIFYTQQISVAEVVILSSLIIIPVLITTIAILNIVVWLWHDHLHFTYYNVSIHIYIVIYVLIQMHDKPNIHTDAVYTHDVYANKS